MKNVMTKNRAAIIALAVVLSTAFSNPVLATTKSDPPIVEVKYLGIKESNPVFEVIMSNDKPDNYLVKIKDKWGYTLFTEKLKGSNVSRKYRFDTDEEIKTGGLVFEVWSANTRKTEIYTVGVTETVKTDVAVNKIQ